MQALYKGLIATAVISAALIAGLVVYVMVRDRALRARAGQLDERTCGDDGRS